MNLYIYTDVYDMYVYVLYEYIPYVCNPLSPIRTEQIVNSLKRID